MYPLVTTIPIDAASPGDNVIVSASRYAVWPCVLVYSYSLKVAAGVTIQWLDSAGTALSGPMSYAAIGDGISEPLDPNGYFLTLPGESLILNLSSGVGVGGYLKFAYVTSQGVGWQSLLPPTQSWLEIPGSAEQW